MGHQRHVSCLRWIAQDTKSRNEWMEAVAYMRSRFAHLSQDEQFSQSCLPAVSSCATGIVLSLEIDKTTAGRERN